MVVMAIAVVYITFKDKKQADKVLSVLIKEKLVACANSFPISSIFNWKGKVSKGKEIVAICKTKHALVNAVQARVKALHSYKVPCVVSWSADANREYENWVFDSTTNNF